MHRVVRPIRPVLLGLISASAIASAIASAALAAEPASVKVDLSDKGGNDRIILSIDKVKAGAVEFEVKNSSKDQMHEFLIGPWKGKITALPYNDTKGQVKEDKLSNLEGVEDMKPLAEATMRLVLKAGKYVVFCNQPGHYKLGMVARFTVTK